MTDTKELLQRIAALRARLNPCDEPVGREDAVRALQARVERGNAHNALLESALRSSQRSEPAGVSQVRLTARGARLVRRGREFLQALRQLADETEFQETDDADPLRELQRESATMIELLLRIVQTFPSEVSEQLRMCDGLDIVLSEIDRRVALLSSCLGRRKHESARIGELADYLRRLAAQQTAGLAPLQGLAQVIWNEVQRGAPLRFLHAAPADPARFAAAHCLNVAQVVGRVLAEDAQWQPQMELALMACLVHDVGMVRVPADVLMAEGPLDDDQRRLIEKHTTCAAELLAPLWPGAGWPIEAATDHHERSDGTGYPRGQCNWQVAPFTQVLAACDIYAALCAPRPQRPALDTRTALTEILLLAEREFLDRAAAERLLALSFYPVGSVVELSDGAIGLVVAAPQGASGITQPDRPVVQIALDAQGQPPAWPIVIRLHETRECRIVRGLDLASRRARLGRLLPQLA